MPRNRKCYHRDSVVDLCFSTEEGLPLVASPIIRVLINSILARAQTMYPVTIVDLLTMPNHVHMLTIVRNPADYPKFKEYFKRELSHAINDLLGRNKRTVWISGCDDPVVLDAEKAMSRIVYVYTNPQEADQVNRIEDYPNVNSWQAFLDGGSTIVTKRIPRSCVPKLPRRTLSLVEQKEIADRLIEEGHEQFELVIEPDAWMQCYPELDGVDAEQINREIIDLVRKKEEEFAALRTHPPVGAHALMLASMTVPYESKRSGRRSICLGSVKAIRVKYLFWRKATDKLAREVYQQWCAGDNKVEMPPGMFWPGGRLATPLELPVYAFCSDY